MYAVKGALKEKKQRKQRVMKAAKAAGDGVSNGVVKNDAITLIRDVRALALRAGGYEKLKQLVDALVG